TKPTLQGLCKEFSVGRGQRIAIHKQVLRTNQITPITAYAHCIHLPRSFRLFARASDSAVPEFLTFLFCRFAADLRLQILRITCCTIRRRVALASASSRLRATAAL